MLRLMTIALVVFALGTFGLPAGAQDKISSKEIKAALKKARFDIAVDEEHPDKPVIGIWGYKPTIDEKTAALLKGLTHLESIGGYDLKFAPGAMKLLKGHPALERLRFQGSTDLAAIKELPEGPQIKELHMGGGAFTVEHFEAIAQVPSIRTVSIYLATIKPDDLRPLHKLKHLEVLILPRGHRFPRRICPASTHWCNSNAPRRPTQSRSLRRSRNSRRSASSPCFRKS
ncbi:hypothetical protein [Frigoriglobus tundricola]|uniref:Leucine Rich repeats (2 copies) n=1 Tax=Frigoriglobus tundricola TaxID=2774151 RepID=A0A6M5YIG2_9BACT|nr:hypothetical protein [Frigoriglobus tundricola]QJW93837.1 hypothetical protein FTUN_1349 [Frigoriglobus tundricola]